MITESVHKILQQLRAELLIQGFDATDMSDEELLDWCELAGIEVNPTYLN